MDNIATFSITVFMGFFAITNPFSTAPVFFGLIHDLDKHQQQKIAKTSTFLAFLIVALFVIVGKYIFQVFGITIPAFKITGGILLFFVGFDVLQSKKSQINEIQSEVDESIAISPLAIPILAGPGTIVTATNFVSNGSYLNMGIVIGMWGLMCFLIYLSFRTSEMLIRKIGPNITKVISKLMGLILAILGTNMVIEGIFLAIKKFNP